MSDKEKVFKYKLDFYYQSALIYVGTLMLYGGIRGSFVEKKFSYVMNDPLVYLILAFVVMSLVALVLNLLRGRRLIITPESIIFKHRWQEQKIPVGQIEWLHIGRESRVQTGGRFQVIVFKLKGRRRLFRVRVGRYERERELVAEMTRIAGLVPRRRQGRWRSPKIMDQ